MRFGLFFVGEYVAMSASSALIVTLFFGGYHLPYLNTGVLKSNMPLVLAFIVIALPLVSYLFAKWIGKNNHWKEEGNIRNRESKILIQGILVINVGIIFLLGIFLREGLGEDGVNIATAVIQVATFAIKLLLMNFVFVWVRWTLPRFRYDQLQDLGWKVLMPLAIANILVTATVVVVLGV